jgi:hypothetical protein
MQSSCAVVCCLFWPVWLYHIFSTLSHKRHVFRRNVTEHKSCVLISLQTFLIVRRIERDVIINVHMSSCQVPVILVRLMKLELFRHIFENTQIRNYLKIRPAGAEFIYADGKTDRQT